MLPPSPSLCLLNCRADELHSGRPSQRRHCALHRLPALVVGLGSALDIAPATAQQCISDNHQRYSSPPNRLPTPALSDGLSDYDPALDTTAAHVRDRQAAGGQRQETSSGLGNHAGSGRSGSGSSCAVECGRVGPAIAPLDACQRRSRPAVAVAGDGWAGAIGVRSCTPHHARLCAPIETIRPTASGSGSVENTGIGGGTVLPWTLGEIGASAAIATSG